MDTTGFDQLYRTWYAPLWRFARTLVRTEAEAQDVVQDVFSGLLARGNATAITISIEAYLFRAVRNAALDRARHDSVRQRFDDTVHDPVAIGEPGIAPDVLTEIHDIEQRVATAITALPERQRTATLLRWHYGMNAADIGRVMDISDTAARKLLASAEAKLRPLLQ